MNNRLLRIGAFAAALSAVGFAVSARADEPGRTVTIELTGVPLSQVIQLLGASGNIEIVFNDPEGKLADKKITYINLRDRPVEKALEVVCNQAGVHYEKDKDGIYVISPKGAEPRAANGSGGGNNPGAFVERPVPVELTTSKISLQFMDPNECLRMLLSSSTRKPLSEAGHARDLDEFDVMPGVFDPATGNWVLPQNQAPVLPPIFSPNGGAKSGAQGGTGAGQIFPGGGGGGFGGGGLGGGGLGGGLGGGGLGGGLGGGGLGGQGGGGVPGLVPEGITGILGYPLDNSLLVRGTPEDIQQLKNIIRLLDIPPRQLSIKIEQIAVTSTFSKSFGIDWSSTYNDISIRAPVGLSSGGAINVGIIGDNWRVAFAAAVQSGKASVIDSLVVTTMNNVPAFITQTSITYIFLPNIGQVNGAGLLTTYTPVPLQAQTTLFATPRINGDGTITMVIPFQLSRFVGESVGPDGTRIPNQTVTILQAIRRVASGQTIVVGGIINRNESTSSNGIPILKDLPFIGSLFRNKLQSRSNAETLFFFTPTILDEPSATGLGNNQ